MVRTLIVGLICVAGAVVGPAEAATKVGRWSETVSRAWWEANTTPSEWLAERSTIHDQLREIHERIGTGRALANSHFMAWVDHLKWLSLFPDHWEEDPVFEEPEARGAFLKIAQFPPLRDRFLHGLSPFDDHAKALAVLCRIYRAHPVQAREYPALAVALSLVFDQPFPESWPHHFVDGDAVPRGDALPEDRFAFFVDSQRKRELFYDLRRLSVTDLKFVVDTPVPLTELAYAQRVKLRGVKQLHDLFSTIQYDLPRLERQDYLWPHGPYQLFAIGQKGGLCVDQAYFTAHTAKAKGVPCIVFLGQGNSGEHAWLGYLESYGRWRFDLAKFRSEDYPVGQAFDPQTWRRLTDSECRFLDRRSDSDPRLINARRAVAWAELNPRAPFYAEVVRQARRLAPHDLWAWELEAAHLSRIDAPPEDRIRFWDDWIKTFSTQEDLRFRGEKRLLGLLEEAGRTSDYNRLLRQVIAENKNERFDLVVAVAAEKVFVHVESKRWEDAHRTFRSAMQKLASKSGGHLFYQLVQPYVQSCLEENKTAYAKEAMERAGRSFRDRKPGSILDKDLEQLSALVDATARN